MTLPYHEGLISASFLVKALGLTPAIAFACLALPAFHVPRCRNDHSKVYAYNIPGAMSIAPSPSKERNLTIRYIVAVLEHYFGTSQCYNPGLLRQINPALSWKDKL